MIGEAGNGEEALLRLRMLAYDAVLLDINMPGMGGVEACRRIFHTYPRLPVIMLTVRDDEEDKVEALDAGAHDYVTKSFQVRELTARLRAAIRGSKTTAVSSDPLIAIGDLVLNPGRYRSKSLDRRFTFLRRNSQCCITLWNMHVAPCLITVSLPRYGDRSTVTSANTCVF
jgi:two-component system KDP operon response regulator KdpE